jgi:hypothetical protein
VSGSGIERESVRERETERQRERDREGDSTQLFASNGQ